MAAPADDFRNETVVEAVERKSLSGVFNAFVRETVREVPTLAGQFVILNIPENRIHMDVDHAKAGFDSEAALVNYLSKIQASYAPQHTSFAHYDAKTKLAMIIYNGPDNFQMFANPKTEPHKTVANIMDHELGHLLVRGAYYSTSSGTDILYAEAAADSFAGLRHISRFGGDAKDMTSLSWQRARSLLEDGDKWHFTSFTLGALAYMARDTDLSALDIEDAARLAARIASETTPHKQVVENLCETFAPLTRQAIAEKGYDQALRPLMDAFLSSSGAGYFTGRLLNIFLSPMLNGEIKFESGPLVLEGPYWDNVRQALKTQNEARQQQGIFMGLPVKPKTPTT